MSESAAAPPPPPPPPPPAPPLHMASLGSHGAAPESQRSEPPSTDGIPAPPASAAITKTASKAASTSSSTTMQATTSQQSATAPSSAPTTASAASSNAGVPDITSPHELTAWVSIAAATSCLIRHNLGLRSILEALVSILTDGPSSSSSLFKQVDDVLVRLEANFDAMSSQVLERCEQQKKLSPRR